ncbi:MarR family winged helix-turn-helix transcriptional regulator [Actinokineospora sp. HUAS TT18]|uniref:MarR family winged helix-turn-helix transcriptional regulator n=1 Tax=Actinokineospora sp. HUAS TT18 TaxID=3447451 RepID=UPI003F51B09E
MSDELIEDWVRLVPEIDPVTEGVVERVHLIARALNLACAEIATPHGINTRDYDILARLYWTGEPHRLTPTQLANGTGAPTTTITSRLDRLERLGLLRRVPAEHDRRSLLAELSTEGVDLFRRMVKEQAAIEASAFRKLDEADLVALRELLDKALSACRETMTPPPRRVELAGE